MCPRCPPTARTQVITSLGERQKSHVPYRNSMLTSVLRDSLGGNCKTVMVATMSPDEAQSDETISTCRFSQRVALISNRLELNEEVDPKLLIQPSPLNHSTTHPSPLTLTPTLTLPLTLTRSTRSCLSHVSRRRCES